MIISFDLDDTLYNEYSFIKSGFKAVSKYLFQKYSIPQKESYSFLEKRFTRFGRKQILDEVLKNFNIYSKKNVLMCLSVYRKHKPKIKLYPEANQCLKRFKDFPIYIVTDGNKLVQKNKIKALGLHKRVKGYILTSEYGLKNSKPSPYCFLKICKKEKSKPENLVYIGDNPKKDFVGLKPLGMKTIRVMKSQYKDIKKSKKFEAHYKIDSIKDLTMNFVQKIFEEA